MRGKVGEVGIFQAFVNRILIGSGGKAYQVAYMGRTFQGNEAITRYGSCEIYSEHEIDSFDVLDAVRSEISRSSGIAKDDVAIMNIMRMPGSDRRQA